MLRIKLSVSYCVQFEHRAEGRICITKENLQKQIQVILEPSIKKREGIQRAIASQVKLLKIKVCFKSNKPDHHQMACQRQSSSTSKQKYKTGYNSTDPIRNLMYCKSLMLLNSSPSHKKLFSDPDLSGHMTNDNILSN